MLDKYDADDELRNNGFMIWSVVEWLIATEAKQLKGSIELSIVLTKMTQMSEKIF